MLEKYKIPLLKDHHNHPSFYTAASAGLDLRNVREKSEAFRMIQGAQGGLIFVIGWDDSRYFFTQGELDRLPPVLICNTSLHKFIASQRAKAILKHTYPEFTENLEDPNWIERNLPKILKLTIEIGGCQSQELRNFFNCLQQKGVWFAAEMLVANQEVITAFDEAGLAERTEFWADPDSFLHLSELSRKRIKGIKLFSDGALGARTAAMRQPLLTGETGLLNYSDSDFLKKLKNLSRFKKPFAVHAIGDRAIEQALNVVESLRSAIPDSPEVRIEHAQFITQHLARRAKDLDITLSMQPNFSPESVSYKDRLTRGQRSQNNCFRMLIDEVGYRPGKDLLFGSDGMPHGVEYALQSSLFPPNPSQELTLEEFIAGYCMPDYKNGFLEFSIDRDHRKVEIERVVEN
jgi:predicted amidohydrolase YtcJ